MTQYSWYISRRRLIQRAPLIIAVLLVSTITIILLNASLFRTIPIILPFFNYIPTYHNQWSYIPPSTIHYPNNGQYNAALVALVESNHASVAKLRHTMRDLEDNFNRHYNYPYIIFSPKLLETEYKELISSLTKGDVVFHELDKYTYGYANNTDRNLANMARKKLKDMVVFGDDQDYRFRARFMGGLIFRHPALKDLDYYWRFDPGTEYTCPIVLDPFQHMYDNNIKLSFSIASYEPFESMPTLCDSLSGYLKNNPQIPNTNLKQLIQREENGNCTQCSFSSSFQIADLSFFKSEEYRKFFDYIDNENGIFYERWSDSIIQSIAAGLLLEKKDIHYWEDIGYKASYNLKHCPPNKSQWLKCSCRPENNFDTDPLSCLPEFFKLQ